MRLGMIVKKWRLMVDRDVRSVGKEIGISAATLSRIERGHSPSGKSLAKILTWMTSGSGSMAAGRKG